MSLGLVPQSLASSTKLKAIPGPKRAPRRRRPSQPLCVTIQRLADACTSPCTHAAHAAAIQLLHRALLGLLLLHRVHKYPGSLLDAPLGSSHPCHLAAFHIAYEALCRVAQQSPDYDYARLMPPVHVLYGMVVLVPPEALQAVLQSRGPYAHLAGPSGCPAVKLFSQQHLELVVTVSTLFEGYIPLARL